MYEIIISALMVPVVLLWYAWLRHRQSKNGIGVYVPRKREGAAAPGMSRPRV
jgi:hypothetical protein